MNERMSACCERSDGDDENGYMVNGYSSDVEEKERMVGDVLQD